MPPIETIIIDPQLIGTTYECENDKEGHECGHPAAWCITAFAPDGNYSTWVCLECAEEIYGGVEAFAQQWADSIAMNLDYRVEQV